MHEWSTRMLLKHYLDQGLTKAELSRLFPASVCFQTAPRRVAVARQAKMPTSARVVRRDPV